MPRWLQLVSSIKHLKKNQPWPVSSVGQNVPVRQGCRFDPQPGHVQEATNKCVNKWNNKSTFFFLSLPLPSPLFLKPIKIKNKEELITILDKLPKIRQVGMHPNSLYKVSIILTPKPDKESTVFIGHERRQTTLDKRLAN